MSGTFSALDEDGVHHVLPCGIAEMGVSAFVPLWRDVICLDILVEAQDTANKDDPLNLVFSTQWMDVHEANIRQDEKRAFDDLHVTWPESSTNNSVQPPASVYDGRGAMVSEMDLRLVHKADGIYRLTVHGVTEFIPEFRIETDVFFRNVWVSNNDRTQDAEVVDWFDKTFENEGMTGAWKTGPTAGDYAYEAVRKGQSI